MTYICLLVTSFVIAVYSALRVLRRRDGRTVHVGFHFKSSFGKFRRAPISQILPAFMAILEESPHASMKVGPSSEIELLKVEHGVQLSVTEATEPDEAGARLRI